VGIAQTVRGIIYRCMIFLYISKKVGWVTYNTHETICFGEIPFRKSNVNQFTSETISNIMKILKKSFETKQFLERKLTIPFCMNVVSMGKLQHVKGYSHPFLLGSLRHHQWLKDNHTHTIRLKYSMTTLLHLCVISISLCADVFYPQLIPSLVSDGSLGCFLGLT